MQLNISEMKGKPVAELRAIASEQKTFKERPVGLAAKEYPDWKIGDEFFEPLPDEILAYFNGEKE